MREDGPHGPLTRRQYVTYGGATVGAGVTAGCLGGESETDDPTTGSGDGEDGTAAEPAESADGSYSVTMEPVGTVAFERVPETIAPFTADYADMLVALGHGDAVATTWLRERYKTRHYDQLDGVSIDLDSLTELWSDGVSKEPFYEVDADLHLMDPHTLTDWFQAWDRSDLAEIRDTVAPFLGNVIFRRTDDWHDYRYYTLYEAFERVAEVVQERERFEALRDVRDDLVATVQADLPAPDERPNAALVWGGEQPDEFFPYRLSGNGANKEHFRALGLSDAFAGTGIDGLSTSDSGSIDYEAMLEVDPDSLLVRVHGAGLSREAFEERVVEYMRDHEVGRELTAVQNDRVFRGGPIYSGPLHNLFMIERYATAYFPERFPADELFDRQAVSAIVDGGFDA
ncbi:ABC transporter substrate-binding protein [Halovivax limisalsi]|uniref:ABC transporter substrate-binding protein n=1 Tax=Halovivax limisalsi TaxID=1453760 RepID=UPI001FFDD8CB|nr:ABC transporter substrate-binding protein [Halovivax limisalsi]